MPAKERTRGLPAVGILGGGQLARMMVIAGRRSGFWLSVLDPDPEAPALGLANSAVVASYSDLDAVRRLAREVDVVTFDLEHVDVEVCARLAGEGVRFAPDPAVLGLVQDKLQQKRRLASFGLPVPHFEPADGRDPESLAQLGFPVFQKLRRSGYDGRGVRRLAGPEDLENALPGPSLVQRPIAIQKELAVLVARGPDGSCALYEPVEMVFDPRTHRLEYLRCPVAVGGEAGRELLARARSLAQHAAEALGIVGVLAVELFLDREGELWVNEVAPRPHNSGHHTIEAAPTCQFEQHLRAVSGLPLGRAERITAAAMANLLGEGEGQGPTQVRGLEDALALPGVRVHLYGKARCRQGRKMGHVTALHPDPDDAVRLARAAQRALTIEPAPEAEG